MNGPKTKVTREELHQLVWKRPFVRLAAELGYSYTELVRACEELNVPRPDHSYWSRLRLNLSVAVPPLPEPAPKNGNRHFNRPSPARAA
ncbi:MAG: hypothetical protein MUE94_05150 [Verrucomicrobia bacterium]|jgi:hypothetical protein|nr:hypothetical protein [Verrucomicrobiota bacterium]